MRTTLNETRRALAVKPFLNQQEAAALLGINPVTLRRAIKAGLVPCQRIGKRYIFSKAALEQWAGTINN